jgi:homocysteine S-methyltransferase
MTHEILVIDGGTGTELDAAWSGAANLERPDVVSAVHEDYIRAGARVVIANTFSAGRWPLEAAGLGDRVEEINRLAVRAAHDARERAGRPDVRIAGAMSRGAAVDYAGAPRPVDVRSIYDEQAELLATAGVDLIALEMISGADYGRAAIEAAAATGLPVWLGVSAGRRADGRLVCWNNIGVDFDDFVAETVSPNLDAVLVMHTEIDDVDEALDAVFRHWEGTVGVYPHSGSFTPPNWHFSDLTPDELVSHTRRWVGRGARIVGGCCGTGPEHIAALAAEFAPS